MKNKQILFNFAVGIPINKEPMEKELKFNRIRIILDEKNISNRCLAEKLGKTEMTVSRWCTNKSQPNVAQLFEIAKVLNVDVKELLDSSAILNLQA